MHLTQTDVYLEELTDVVPETDNTTQTDAFLERPPTPKFVPAKSGVDAETQVEDGRCLAAFHTQMTCQHTAVHHWLDHDVGHTAAPKQHV